MFALGVDAVKVAIPQARVSRVTQQDQGIRQRLEPALNGGLQSLVGLRVVVHHQRDGVYGHDLHQGIVKDLAQIGAVAPADLAEVVDQGSIEERELLVHAFEVTSHVIEGVFPELSDEEPAGTELFVHHGDELAQELLAVMLDGIEADTLERQLLGDPFSPVQSIVDHFLVVVVNVRAHEEIAKVGQHRRIQPQESGSILVALLGVDVSVVGPAFRLVAEDLENASLFVTGVVVDAAEVVPMPLHLAVLLLAAGEGEAHPCLDLVRVADVLVAVLLIDLNGLARLLLVRGELVVQHSVEIEADARLLCGGSELEELFLGAPLGRDAALLVELAQVVQIVDVISIPRSGGALASARTGFCQTAGRMRVSCACYLRWRDPDVVHSPFLEIGDGLLESHPVLLIRGYVPLEALQHGHVLRRGFLFFRHLERRAYQGTSRKIAEWQKRGEYGKCDSDRNMKG